MSGSLSRAVYRTLLRVYPTSFRDRFAPAMCRDFEDLLRTEIARSGRRGVFAAWRRALPDLIRSGLRERLTRVDSTAPTPSRPRGERVFSLIADARYALRGLGRAKGFAVAATLTLALGIGANTAIFALINAVLLTPLPYRDPGQLVRIHQHNIEDDDPRAWVSPAFYKDLETQNEVLASIAAWYPGAATISGPEGETEYMSSAVVTPSFFDVLGVPPLMGRTFREEDAEPGIRRVVLGEDYWRARFAGAPDIVGRTMTRNRIEYEIIGVVPSSVDLPAEAMMWTSISNTEGRWDNRGSHYLQIVGRLLPATTLGAARANLDAITARAAQEYPQEQVGWGVSAFPLQEDLTHEIRPALLMLQGAVLVVLLIACVNVANLQLARSNARTGEFALRTALGASRPRIAQQVIIESLLLAAGGAFAGIGVGSLLVGSLLRFAPAGIVHANTATFDLTVLGFTGAVAMVTALVFGLTPALRSASAEAGAVVREAGHRAARGGRRFREVLVATEVALSLILLAGAALLLNSFVRLVGVDTGVTREEMLTARVSIPASVYEEPIARAQFFRDLHEAVRQLPGIRDASLVSELPLTGARSYWGNGFRRLDHPPPAPGQGPVAMLRWISPGHLQTVGMPLLRGRAFTYADTEESPHVVLIDQTMAERYFPGEDPVGKRLLIHYNDWDAEIIGIVGNAQQASLDEPLEPHMYVSYWQTYTPMFLSSMIVTIRAAEEPEQFIAPLRRVIAQIDPLVVPTDIETFEDRIAQSVAAERFSLLLVAVFATLAAFLAAVGLYGVIAYLVSQRTREIGIRVALGAQGWNVLALVLRHGLAITAVGLAFGVVGLMATQKVLEQFLYQVDATDPLTILAVCVLLGSLATAATLLPARRAAKLDPVTALR